MLGPTLGHALRNGALLTVQSNGPETLIRTDSATLLGQVVAITHPCTGSVPLPTRPSAPAPTPAQSPATL